MKRTLISIIGALALIVAAPAVAFAHVVVTPNQAAVGDRVLFDVSVPNEKQVAVTSIKLVIPKGLQDVQPTVIAGWDIHIGGGNDTVTDITWTGTIPTGQRADLFLKAQMPASVTQLDWKAYQTYADGTVVHWDQKPAASGSDDTGTSGPYSVTKVIDDLHAPAANTEQDSRVTLAFVLSTTALALSVVGLFAQRKRVH